MIRQRIVLTVHGKCLWAMLKRLSALLTSEDQTMVVECYGNFSVFAFLFPPLHWVAIPRFKKQLIRVLEKNPAAQIDLVCPYPGVCF